ncbi:MAG: RDD family protein [Cytophagales bacterium]|nr:RDD family protein [Cytophaga sp.]
MALATLGFINEYILYIPGVDKIFGALVVFLYYMQEVINGKSIAKMLFGYSVINVYAEKPTFKEVLIRSISRIVPFEGVSCMSKPSRGWHDKWSGTYVVADHDLSQIREMLETEELQ